MLLNFEVLYHYCSVIDHRWIYTRIHHNLRITMHTIRGVQLSPSSRFLVTSWVVLSSWSSCCVSLWEPFSFWRSFRVLSWKTFFVSSCCVVFWWETFSISSPFSAFWRDAFSVRSCSCSCSCEVFSSSDSSCAFVSRIFSRRSWRSISRCASAVAASWFSKSTNFCVYAVVRARVHNIWWKCRYSDIC